MHLYTHSHYTIDGCLEPNIGTVEVKKGIVGQDQFEPNNTSKTSTISYVWQDGNH